MPTGVYDRKNSPWTSELKEYARQMASKDRTLVQLAEILSEKAGRPITYAQIKSLVYKNNLPFKRHTRQNIVMTDEQAEYLISIIPGRSSKECMEMINEKYGLHLTLAQIRGWKKNHKTPSGYDTKFRPGEKSWITGKKFPGRTNSGCWTKGHVATNARKIGDVQKHGGYWEIKIQDGHGNDNWVPLHRYIYEQVYGKIPEGYKILFLDRNTDNFEPDNLVCVSAGELNVANHRYGLMVDQPELNRAILSAARLQITISEKGKKK